MSMIKKSPWVSFFNCGGCNGCTLEMLACFDPKYDVERFGIQLQSSSKHADVLVVSGIITEQIKPRLERVYNQMADDKKVIAIGTCAITGGFFRESYAFAGPLDKVIPVDIYVPGCAPRPESIIDGIVKVLKDGDKGSSKKS